MYGAKLSHSMSTSHRELGGRTREIGTGSELQIKSLIPDAVCGPCTELKLFDFM